MQKEVNGVPTTPMGQVSPNLNTIRQATVNPMTGNNTPNFNLDANWKSLDITELIKALCKSQMDMSAVVQSKVNPFYKSNYADINDLLRSVLPVITKHGLAVTQGNRFCTETNGFYVTTTLCHVSGQWIKSEVRIPMGKSGDAQAVGQMCTYGRRYGLGAILGISVTKDDDGNSLRK
jgi:hypothetical protein